MIGVGDAISEVSKAIFLMGILLLFVIPIIFSIGFSKNKYFRDLKLIHQPFCFNWCNIISISFQLF